MYTCKIIIDTVFLYVQFFSYPLKYTPYEHIMMVPLTGLPLVLPRIQSINAYEYMYSIT